MRPKLLGLQFRARQDSIEQEQACIVREAGIYCEVNFISALNETLAWDNPAELMNGYDGIILGGSGEFDFDGGRPADDESRQMSQVFLGRLRPLCGYIFAHDLPTLGICYGHQLLGAFAGAEVRYSEEQKKVCSHPVKLLVDKNDYFLLADLPESFSAHYGHKDVLDRIPEGATLLMDGGEKCQVSALRYKNNIYTTQFHPELTFADMVERIKNSPGYLPEGVVAEEIFSHDPDSNRILRNFGRLVAEKVGQLAKASVSV